VTVPRVELAPGYSVPRVIHGAWQLSEGHRGAAGAPDRDEAVQGLLRLAEAGFDTFDCADIYTGVRPRDHVVSCLAGRADGAADALDPKLATEPAEAALVNALGEAGPQIEAAVADGRFEEALTAAAELGPPVDRFFDEVLVMAEDTSIRANRLRLLLDVRDTVGLLGDLSLVPR